jgi:hypothetical protein
LRRWGYQHPELPGVHLDPTFSAAAAWQASAERIPKIIRTETELDENSAGTARPSRRYRL